MNADQQSHAIAILFAILISAARALNFAFLLP